MDMTQPTWTYQGRIFNNINDFPEDTYGFIYEVTHKPTGQKYIGKKVLRFERNKRLGKRALEALREERKAQGIGGRLPLKQLVVTESDWKEYYGSHPTIIKHVKESNDLRQDFERRILEFVSNKKLLTYYECKHLFINDVLETHNHQFINDNILGKFYRKDFNND
jgi:serine/threonine protein kinase